MRVISATDIDPSPAYRTPTDQYTDAHPRRSKRVVRSSDGRVRRSVLYATVQRAKPSKPLTLRWTLKLLTMRNGNGDYVNSAIVKIAKWARSQGWRVEDDASGYTRFCDRDGEYIARYPATPGNERRRMHDLIVALRRAGLAWPAPSKKEQRAQREKGAK